MKRFIRNTWPALVAGLVLIILFWYFNTYFEAVKVGGTVIQHNVTSDRDGRRIYSTLIRMDDGYIREEVGLNIYTIPVGGRTTIEITRPKK